MIWMTTPNSFDLFKTLSQNSNQAQNSKFRLRKERQIAIKMLTQYKMLNKTQRSALNSKFEEYIEDIGDRIILLRKKDSLGKKNFELNHEDFKSMDYKTRFTDESKIKAQVWQYHKLWEVIPSNYNKAVHLVLTTDPKRFNSVLEANKHFGRAFNRFMSYLTKYFRPRDPAGKYIKGSKGERPLYLCVNEFTWGSPYCREHDRPLEGKKKRFCPDCQAVLDSEDKIERYGGLLHAHIIIFGRGYLMPKDKITAEWERCGQGSYNYVYSLKRNQGAWEYSRGKPKDLKKEESVEDYLKKYLVKGLFDVKTQSLYWAFNKRFYSFAYRLKKWSLSVPRGSGEWVFFGSFYDFSLPEFVFAPVISWPAPCLDCA